VARPPGELPRQVRARATSAMTRNRCTACPTQQPQHHHEREAVVLFCARFDAIERNIDLEGAHQLMTFHIFPVETPPATRMQRSPDVARAGCALDAVVLRCRVARM